jgi:hypothetical protein
LSQEVENRGKSVLDNRLSQLDASTQQLSQAFNNVVESEEPKKWQEPLAANSLLRQQKSAQELAQMY